MKTLYKWLRFGEGHTSKEVCKKCGAPATGIAMLCGFFPMFACDPCEVELRKADAAADAEVKDNAFAAQEFVA